MKTGHLAKYKREGKQEFKLLIGIDGITKDLNNFFIFESKKEVNEFIKLNKIEAWNF